MFNNQESNKIALIVILAVLVVGFSLFYHSKMNTNQYSVVYLTTGDVYIGKLQTFPDLELTNGYIFLATKDPTDPTKNNFQLNPLSESVWAPQKLVLTEKNVVFYGPLSPSSKIAQTLAAKGK